MGQQTLPGFRDFYPEEMAVRRHLDVAWHAAAAAAGFREVDGPVLESLELFTKKSGDEIAGQLYSFEDKGQRPVALRPEMTPTLARMIAARAGALPKPIKWYSVQRFFRYERPQRGRFREFFQWNVDVVGAPEIAADVDAIAVALDGLRRLGLGSQDLVVRINDRRFVRELLREIDVGPEQEVPVLGLIDKLARDPKAPERLTELLGERRARKVSDWCENLPMERAPVLGELLETADEYGLRGYLEPDFRIVRGLAYYTGPVWEIFARGTSLRSVAGGGRYDGLIAMLGGPDLPALGFGMGDAVLTEFLAERGLLPDAAPALDAYVIPVAPEMVASARDVARRLRAGGARVDLPYGPVKPRRGLRDASRAGAGYAVLVGPDEWADRSVRIRDLASGSERLVPVDELASADILAT